MLPDLDVTVIPREELPALLGKLTELEARCRLRLAEVPTPAPAGEVRLLDAAQAAALAAVSPRWLMAHTRGLRCRRDLSRKAPRWDEGELRAWLASRRRS